MKEIKLIIGGDNGEIEIIVNKGQTIELGELNNVKYIKVE